MSRIRHILHRTPFHPHALRSCRTPHSTHHNALPLPFQSRIRWSYFWYASILALGITTGLGARHFAAPLGLPLPGSREDEIILSSLSTDIDNLDIVKSLRTQSYNLSTDTSLRSGPGLGSGGGRKISAYKDWLELDFRLGEGQDAGSGILGVMSGTRGLGVQRAFWNAASKEMVAVVWIGGGLSGWPGVAHGGAIATVFEEVMARMMRGPEGSLGMYICPVQLKLFNLQTGCLGSRSKLTWTTEPTHRPDSLAITYAKPTYSLDFYILRASFTKPDLPQTEPPPEPEAEPIKSWLSWLSPAKDLTKKTDSRPQKAVEIVGTLENVKGDLCVKAKGTFGVSSSTI